jgi:hypothetical protein
MNRQIMFNRVANHLLTQLKHSIDATSNNAYRGISGRKCGIGALIDDQFYSPELEFKTSSSPQVSKAIACTFNLKSMTWEDIKFILTLQSVHDMNRVEDWATRLRELALHYGLIFDEVVSRRLSIKEKAPLS